MRASVKDKDLEDESPDHLSDAPDFSSVENEQPTMPPVTHKAGIGSAEASEFEPHSPASRNTELMAKGADSGAAEPTPGQMAAPGGAIILNVNGVTVPMVIGKSLRSAVEASQAAGLELDAHGSGVAREQSPAPGMKVPPGTKLVVRFAR